MARALEEHEKIQEEVLEIFVMLPGIRTASMILCLQIFKWRKEFITNVLSERHRTYFR